MKKSFLTLVVFTLTMMNGLAHADSQHTEPGFYDLIESYRQHCTDGCHEPFGNKVTFEIDAPQNAELGTDIQAHLLQVASNQAQVWGDTILEGDYYSDGNTRLDRVSSLFENGQLIGYQITYSEGAWYTGECDFNGEESSLKDCAPGRIKESSFVSPNFGDFFRDDDDYADFVE
ncbi:hypothetical protein [Bdellovibrio sp. HCB337]|uniref:hypothetical protein n=1 Tax=Bdellovibrio sp. HCB337 TaxID=3394358 RepID=UPI0039A53798